MKKRGKGRRHDQPDSIIIKKLFFGTRETCQGDRDPQYGAGSEKTHRCVVSCFFFLIFGCSSLSCSMQNL